MSLYHLTEDAEQDLRDIARYTLDNWGIKQLEKYRSSLKKRFITIGKNEIIKRHFSQKMPDVYVTKSGGHFIFYLAEENQKPIIIAVIHESRDILEHLTARLNA
ncbi:MAG: type II toxin-antitoxin system RelE/ParE family toxin [Alteromonadaceae bacterium]|nr:type II toxin-antitoxin system RelE/ParE family toxin [Alteromonadaceae bacterium]